jgi:hypothetical protein
VPRVRLHGTSATIAAGDATRASDNKYRRAAARTFRYTIIPDFDCNLIIAMRGTVCSGLRSVHQRPKFRRASNTDRTDRHYLAFLVNLPILACSLWRTAIQICFLKGRMTIFLSGSTQPSNDIHVPNYRSIKCCFDEQYKKLCCSAC